MAVILHNACRDPQLCMRHEDQAIAAARLSRHPAAKKQLAACLLNKARTLMSEEMDQEQIRALIREAEPLVMQHTEPLDEERYQFACDAAMCCARDGDREQAERYMQAADEIAFASPDSDLAVAEHLLEENAPFRAEMGQYDLAEEAVMQAVTLCDRHAGALRYRETAFDAWFFLGRLRAMAGRWIKAEEAYGEAERRLGGTYFSFPLPLCPEEIRMRAERERNL